METWIRYPYCPPGIRYRGKWCRPMSFGFTLTQWCYTRATLMHLLKLYNRWVNSLVVRMQAMLCQKQVSSAGTSTYIQQIMWDVITGPYPWYLLRSQHTSFDRLQYIDRILQTKFPLSESSSGKNNINESLAFRASILITCAISVSTDRCKAYVSTIYYSCKNAPISHGL